ncbi:hypothetical protein ACHAWT_004621 [Skeletonema menzelii]
MNVDSYIAVHLPKPIGIRFEENNSNYGGVFVADIDDRFSAAADGTIKLGYQLIAVGGKRVSGMQFDEAVMQPIVDNTEAEVTLMFFTGSAACLYHPSSADENEEWLNNFVAMHAKKPSRNYVGIKDDVSSIDIVPITTDDICDDDASNEVISEECNQAVQDVIIEEAKPSEQPFDDLDLSGQDFYNGANNAFFSNVPDLSTTSFDWTPKKNLMPDEDLFEREEENNGVNPWLQSFQDDALQSSSQTQAAEEGNLLNIDAETAEAVGVGESNDDKEASLLNINADAAETVSVGESNDDKEASLLNIDVDAAETVSVGEFNEDNVASKTESDAEGEDNKKGDTNNVRSDQSEGDDEAAYVEIIGSCVSPQVRVRYSPSSALELREEEDLPEVSEDDVLIRVDATTIATRDCLERIRRNNNKMLKDEKWVPGHEIVGHVVRAGKNVKVLLDRKVASLLSYGGGCSRYVCIPAKNLISLPETANSNEMVALLSTYMAAYQCLEIVQRIDPVGQSLDTAVSRDVITPEDTSSSTKVAAQKKSPLSGSSVLIIGAGSPVGLALIDIAKNAGATVYAVSHSSHEKDIRELGIKEWYPLYRKKEWKTAWAGKMNLIVDTVGDYDNYPIFYEVMASGGSFVRMNTTSCGKKYVPVLEEQVKVFSALKDYKGSRINNTAIDYDVFYSFNDDQELFTEDLAYLYRLLQTGRIEPRVFSRVGFDELHEEWEKVMGGGASGVVVVLPWKD